MKPNASLSLDLDNKWSYLKTRGDRKWESYPSYLDIVVPRFLEFLKQFEVRITVFIVGRDADAPENADAMSALAESQHEIGNHSYEHQPWLHRYSEQELRDEIEQAENAIWAATGRKPSGFRGPGFSTSQILIDVLSEKGYKYDCSVLPTFIGPFARLFYFMNGPRLTLTEKQQRSALFGKFSDGFQSLRPKQVKARSGTIVSIPVTTFPIVKTPIHFSYLIYLASISPALAKAYWNAAIAACRTLSVEPSLLLHSLDFLGCDDDRDLAFFPGMNLSFKEKMKLLEDFVSKLCSSFNVLTVGEHAANVLRLNGSASEFIENHN